MRRWRVILGIALLAGLQCDQIDEDPEPLLVQLSGAGATDCGFANGNAFGGGGPTVAEVRACVEAALQAGRAFRARVEPASADGAITIGWASNGTAWWRVEYNVISGCSPVSSDSLGKQECQQLRDLGRSCASLWKDLCYACVPR
jgi:hypothetical protein